MSGKLGMTTTQRKAVLRNQASNLLWYGRLETTLGRAKELRPYAEKIITLAMNTYDDTVETTVVVKDKKGKDVTTKVLKDGPKKLAARRKISHPLIEKIFNEIAPKYAQRAEELKQRGGYTRIYQLGERKGDAAPTAIIELV